MNRRRFLQNAGAAAVGLGFSGCASRTARVAARPQTHHRVDLPLVNASWERVIRTTVGLRPHRDSGFRLEAEKLDQKMLIHNYGHGGAGMSLSWGTGQMAAELALEHTERRAAVIGCGVVGLTSARQLQRRGFEVTIYAMAVPPNTTSNMSLAGFTPTSGLVDRRTPEWDAQFRRAAEIAYTQLQLLARPEYGISWIYSYSPSFNDNNNAPQGSNTLLPPQLRTGQVVLQPGEHPFPTKYAIERVTMRIEPSIYLDALVRDFLLWGGHIKIRKFDTPRDLATLSEPIIVNCTGLGAQAIFGDQDLVPLKGQLTHFVPQPEVNYQTLGGTRPEGPNDFGIHMMPRHDGIALGGTSERGVWSLEPNEEARKRIVDAHIALFTAMKPPNGKTLLASASTQPPSPPPLESFSDLQV
jgi:glycine/D-amino acid oxidase-like deaminating enzyme